MYGGPENPPWPPSPGENAPARVGSCPNRVQTAVDRAKSLALTGLRHCLIDRYARVWTGVDSMRVLSMAF
jgi:predicted ATPase